MHFSSEESATNPKHSASTYSCQPFLRRTWQRRYDKLIATDTGNHVADTFVFRLEHHPEHIRQYADIWNAILSPIAL